MQDFAWVGILLVVVSAIFAALGYKGREQVVGIDLGTTFSVVAIKSRDKEVTVIPDWSTGKLLVPSVVSLLPNFTERVGDEAVQARHLHPLSTVFNAKRFIGRSFEEVAADATSHPFRVAANTSHVGEGAPAAGFLLPGFMENQQRWLSPIDIGARVVSRLKFSVAEHMGFEISRAVICVPAKFGQKQIAATQRAFEQAGFKVMRILEEPTAAAVAYGLHKGSAQRHVLVYDIGGGTLDTSLLYMSGNSVSVLGVAGDDHLGGSDFDLRMQDLLTRKLPEAGVSAEEAQARCDAAGLAILAERAKIELSSALEVEVRCKEEGGEVRRIAVTRKEFEEASDDLFKRALKPVETVLGDQMMSADNVDDVVLVGGASRTPRLRELLRDFMGGQKKLHTEIDPDVTVAYGAANILD